MARKILKVGFQRTIEEVAYAWFDRFVAIRFMEVNGFLKGKIRVFSDENGAFKPQILDEAAQLQEDILPGIDLEKVYQFKFDSKNEELFKYLLVLQCNALGSFLPQIFPPVLEDDYAILLLPNNLLRDDGLLARLVAEIPEEDWKDQVQIVGWLYQYYNTEPKAEVFANLKKNVKITPEKIPAATQLFTPDWIVRYMVENSLGRLWIEGHKKPENAEWKYLLQEAKQEPEVEEKLAELRKSREKIAPEEIKCLDPCAGSGHILVYMFDVLVQIYESCGYSAREAAPIIVEKNLFGLDIDERSAQLAYFAVMMKARQYDKRFFERNIQPNVYVAPDADDLDDALFERFLGDDQKLQAEWNKSIAQTEKGRNFGSLMQISGVDFRPIRARFEELKNAPEGVFDVKIYYALEPFARAAEILAMRFDVVCTNPPYMGGTGMNATLAEYLKKNFPDYKSDLFSAFVVRCSQLAKKDGFLGFLTPYVWMFIQSYEKMRNFIYDNMTIETLVQFEYSAFGEATAPICTFALRVTVHGRNPKTG